jgi:hypothetical protein
MSIFTNSSMWLEGSELRQSVVGTDWIVCLEGQKIPDLVFTKKERSGPLGIYFKRVSKKYGVGYMSVHDNEIRYVDANGVSREITKDTKPTVRLKRDVVK